MIDPTTPASPTDAVPARVAARVRLDQIRSHYDLTPQPVLAGMLFAMLLAWTVEPVVGRPMAVAWLAVKLVLGTLRLLEDRLFRRDPHWAQHGERWYWRYYVLMLLDALSWGAIGVLFVGTGQPGLDGIMVASVVGVAAVGVFTLMANLLSATTFLASVLLPTVVQYLTSDSRWGLLGGLGLLVYLGVMAYEAWRGDRLFVEVNRLRHENEWIAEQRRVALVMAQQSSAAKTRFLATVSHEVRTPLNGILGMAQLLQRSTLGSEQQQQVDVVARSARHLRSIIDDILDMARIEAGRVHLERAPFELRATVQEVAGVLAPLMHDKGLDFELRIDDDVAGWWQGDAARVRQVLHNLLGNAIKFTAHGSIVLRVMCQPKGLRMEVHDTGSGVHAGATERIFQPFEQADSGADRRQNGTGLGLSIARQLARAMGGDVVCVATSPRGSVFRFDMASVEHRPEQPAPSPGVADTSWPASPGARVLLVEDNEVNGLVAMAMLDRMGLQGEHVDNGAAALQRLADGRYAAVLMDCQMPGLDGFETTRRLRVAEAAQATGRRTPVVAVTANAGADDRARCLAAGMDDHLSKPFEFADLQATLARHLRHLAGPGDAGAHPSGRPSPG